MRSREAELLHIPLPIEWVRASKYVELTGDPLDTVEYRIREGAWAAGLQYKRTGPRTLWINLRKVTEWLNNQKHIETVAFPKA